jgi:hypothetical protein
MPAALPSRDQHSTTTSPPRAREFDELCAIAPDPGTRCMTELILKNRAAALMARRS